MASPNIIMPNPARFFNTLKREARKLQLKDLSMGMSNDYEKAINNESTYIRLGTAIFGERKI